MESRKTPKNVQYLVTNLHRMTMTVMMMTGDYNDDDDDDDDDGARYISVGN